MQHDALASLTELESALGIDHGASCLQTISHPLLQQKQVQLSIKRDDLLHPIISGNKWRKLKYPLLHALEHGFDHLVSMGGTWSNHLHALAYIGHKLDIKTTGLVRGEATQFVSPTLQDLQDWGMQIEFIDREAYRELRQYHQYNDMPSKKWQGYWLPEGGATAMALRGVQEIKQDIPPGTDLLCVACGTGTTLAGLLPGPGDGFQAVGFAALRGASYLNEEVMRLSGKDSDTGWSINLDYHFGGFGKTTPKLLEFIDQYEQDTGIPLEPIYTGKLMYGLFDLIEKDQIPEGTNIIAIHSGGLQGKRTTR